MYNEYCGTEIALRSISFHLRSAFLMQKLEHIFYAKMTNLCAKHQYQLLFLSDNLQPTNYTKQFVFLSSQSRVSIHQHLSRLRVLSHRQSQLFRPNDTVHHRAWTNHSGTNRLHVPRGLARKYNETEDLVQCSSNADHPPVLFPLLSIVRVCG